MIDKTDVLESLLTAIGPRLTAVAAGLTDARTLVAWRNGAHIPNDAQMRLNVTHEFVKTFTDAGDTPAVAAAYLRGSWPDLNDEAPVVVIRDGGFEDWDELLAVARRVARDGGGF